MSTKIKETEANRDHLYKLYEDCNGKGKPSEHILIEIKRLDEEYSELCEDEYFIRNYIIDLTKVMCSKSRL